MNAETGVVTAEWVALAGAVLIGAITVGWLVLNSLKTPAGSVGSNIASCESLAAAGPSQGTTTSCP
jgi:hypothetical protein